MDRDILWDRACGRDVCSSYRRGGEREPTRRLVAEGYRCWDDGFGVLRFSQAIRKLINDARNSRVRVGAGAGGALEDKKSRFLC